MKNNKKFLLLLSGIIIICVIISLLISQFIYGQKGQALYKGYSYKTWIVYSQDKKALSDIKSLDISVKNSKGKKQDISLQTSSVPNSIVVLPPKGGYAPKETYTISIGSGLSFHLDKTKSKINSLKFTILEGYKDSKIIRFKDKNLEKAVRSEIGKKSGDIHYSDLKMLRTFVATSQNISNVDGIQYMTGLTELYLDMNKIEDISAVGKMYNLTALGLSGNKITNIKPLKNLLNLNKLFLNKNPINSFSQIKDIYKDLYWKDF